MAMLFFLSFSLSPSTLSDKSAIGDISEALKNGIGTVLPAAYIDQSCNVTKEKRTSHLL